MQWEGVAQQSAWTPCPGDAPPPLQGLRLKRGGGGVTPPPQLQLSVTPQPHPSKPNCGLNGFVTAASCSPTAFPTVANLF